MLPSLLLLAALAQPNPAEQIRYLMYESPRPEKHGSEGGTFSVFSCGPANGEAADNRALARISHKPPICIQNRERSAVIRVDFPVFEKSTLGLAKAPLSGARLRA